MLIYIREPVVVRQNLGRDPRRGGSWKTLACTELECAWSVHIHINDLRKVDLDKATSLLEVGASIVPDFPTLPPSLSSILGLAAMVSAITPLFVHRAEARFHSGLPIRESQFRDQRMDESGQPIP